MEIAAGGFFGSFIILLSFTPLLLCESSDFKASFSVVMVLDRFGFKRFSIFLSSVIDLLFINLFNWRSIDRGTLFYSVRFQMTQECYFQMLGIWDPISWFLFCSVFRCLAFFKKQILRVWK